MCILLRCLDKNDTADFDPCVDIYNSDHHLQEVQLNHESLEDAWFINTIIEFKNVLVWHRKRNEVDIELIARDVYALIAQTVDEKWLDHCCDDVGCRERYVFIVSKV